MTRLRYLALFFVAAILPLAAQKPADPKPEESKPAEQQPVEQEPAEEDKSFAKREYAFNPLQAVKEVKIGMFYLKKGSLRAAAGRFDEATKWNPTYAEAWLRLAETQERLKDEKAAHEAFAKYLELDPNSKQAPAIKKKLGTR